MRSKNLINKSENLHIAVSNISIEADTVILPGIELRKTYAYTFSHPILATIPSSPSKSHPGPWQAVRTPGMTAEANVELVILNTYETSLDRILLAQNIIALIRIVTGSAVRAPVFSNIPFSEMSTKQDVVVMQFEPPMNWPDSVSALNDLSITAIKSYLQPLQKLLHEDEFNSAFGLANSIWWLPSLSAQMIIIWAAAEALMRPNRQDMTKNLARLIRAYAGTSPGHGDRLYQRVVALCRARGEAAHAGQQPNAKDVEESYLILRSLLLISMHQGSVPGPIETIKSPWKKD